MLLLDPSQGLKEAFRKSDRVILVMLYSRISALPKRDLVEKYFPEDFKAQN